MNDESHVHACATELRLVAMAIHLSDTINARDESKMLLKLCEADAPKAKLADTTNINNAVGDAVVCINDIM